MRRVVVTGLGAVTPLGDDARSTWEGAVAGRSGVGFIESFDASGYPVRIASEVKGFEPASIVGSKEARRLERNVVLAVAAAREAWADAGVDRRRPRTGGHPRRLGDRRRDRCPRTAGGAARARPLPCVSVVPPERARRLGERPDRHRPRAARPELRPRLRVRDRIARSGGGCGADQAGGRRGRARGRDRGLHAPGDPRRVLRDARPRGRGGGPDPCLAAVRRDARRLRHGGGRLRPAARRARAGAGTGCADLRRGARLRHLERRTSHGAARPRVRRRRGDDAGGAQSCGRGAGARRLRQRARDVDAAGRSRRDARRSRRCSASTRTGSPSPRRSRCSAISSARPARSRR